MAHNSDPGIMSPMAEVAWTQIQRRCFDGLIDYEEQANIVPGLTTSWEISPDGLTLWVGIIPSEAEWAVLGVAVLTPRLPDGNALRAPAPGSY
jgi:hypothetical protein